MPTVGYKQGVSTRGIQSIMNQFGIEMISADTVSRMAQELDEEVQEFLRRSIGYPISNQLLKNINSPLHAIREKISYNGYIKNLSLKISDI